MRNYLYKKITNTTYLSREVQQNLSNNKNIKLKNFFQTQKNFFLILINRQIFFF